MRGARAQVDEARRAGHIHSYRERTAAHCARVPHDRRDVDVDQVPAPADVADLLGVEEGAPVLARRRRMYANDIPVQLATSYLPLDIAAGTDLASTDPGPESIYSRLADLGHAPDAYTETARVRPPDDDEAQFLISESSPSSALPALSPGASSKSTRSPSPPINGNWSTNGPPNSGRAEHRGDLGR